MHLYRLHPSAYIGIGKSPRTNVDPFKTKKNVQGSQRHTFWQMSNFFIFFFDGFRYLGEILASIPYKSMKISKLLLNF